MPFFEENESNQYNIIELLTRDNLSDQDRYSLIRQALQQDSEQANIRDRDGDTPLIYLTDEESLVGNHIDPNQKTSLVNLLLQYNADPFYINTSSHDYEFLGNSSPLVLAAMQGHIDILREYLNHVSQNNPSTSWYDIHNDFAELLVASTEGVHTDVIETLLEDYNFDPNRANGLGQLPLPYLLAIETVSPRQEPNTMELEDDTQHAVAILIKNGADPNLREADNMNKNAYEVVRGLPQVQSYLDNTINEYQASTTMTPG